MSRILINFHGQESFIFLAEKPDRLHTILLSKRGGEKGIYEITKISNGCAPLKIEVVKIGDMPPNVSNATPVWPV